MDYSFIASELRRVASLIIEADDRYEYETFRQILPKMLYNVDVKAASKVIRGQNFSAVEDALEKTGADEADTRKLISSIRDNIVDVISEVAGFMSDKDSKWDANRMSELAVKVGEMNEYYNGRLDEELKEITADDNSYSYVKSVVNTFLNPAVDYASAFAKTAQSMLDRRHDRVNNNKHVNRTVTRLGTSWSNIRSFAEKIDDDRDLFRYLIGRLVNEYSDITAHKEYYDKIVNSAPDGFYKYNFFRDALITDRGIDNNSPYSDFKKAYDDFNRYGDTFVSLAYKLAEVFERLADKDIASYINKHLSYPDDPDNYYDDYSYSDDEKYENLAIDSAAAIKKYSGLFMQCISALGINVSEHGHLSAIVGDIEEALTALDIFVDAVRSESVAG